MYSRRITSAVLALASAAVFVACSDDDDDKGTGPGTNDTTVRFVNATTGGTSLDIAQNGTVGSGNGSLAYGSASSCTRVNAKNPLLAVRTTGSTTALTGFTPSFTAGGTYTVLVTGTTAAPVYTTLNDQFTTPTTGNAGVRIVNVTSTATTGAGNWDIYVNPGTTLGTPNASAVGRNSATTYLTVPAGQANTIRLTNSGSTTTLQNITVPSMTSGTVQTIVVGDAATGSTALRTFTLNACT
ncbi:MAG TPA: DUF4397 domain-containing protein [Gemmatimonadaceae bacterium]|nr:DUF4397 domain-containing protein [Gemmatimonadaceae bacterium]